MEGLLEFIGADRLIYRSGNVELETFLIP